MSNPQFISDGGNYHSYSYGHCALCGQELEKWEQKYCPEHALGCPERYAAYARNRRSKKKGNGGTHTAADVQAQYDYQGGRCFYCGVEVGEKYHVDHFMPLVLGGSNSPENLVIACPACNMAKSARHPIAFCVGLDIERAL